MSETPERVSRLERGAELLPVFAALVLHSLAHDRWLICVPAAVLLVVMVSLGKKPTPSSRLLLIAGIVGGAAGTALTPFWPVPGPIPPLVMGPLSGALVGLTIISGISERWSYAITYALLLSALSAAVRGSVGVYVGLALVAVSLLAAAFIRGRIGRAGLAGALGFATFALVVAGASFGVFRFVLASEGVVSSALMKMVENVPRMPGAALQSEVNLYRMGKMAKTGRLLMELRGDRPERLRTTVFDTFDGMSWGTSPSLTKAHLTLTAPQPGEPLRSTELTLLESLRPYLPAPAGIRAVQGAMPTVLGGWMLRADGKQGTTLTLLREQREQLPTEPPPDASLTALPDELRTELRPLALELTRGAATPRAKAEALEQWFRENYEYSLSVDLTGKGSPLAVFIRERRPAWCIYFAGAMAALLRSLDIPARMAGGFVPQEKNPFTKAFLIREQDAHAWVEVYLPEEGRFVAFDPTPWRSREALQQEQRTSTWAAAWQALTSSLSRWTSRLLDSPLEVLSDVASFPLTWLIVAAGVAWRLFRRYRRGRAPRTREALRGTDPGLETAYSRYLRAMKRGAGLVPAPTETDEELLSRLRTTRGEQAGALAEEFITRYRRARYGGGPVDPASLGKLTKELERHLSQER